MPCYHPLLAIPTGSIGESGKQKYKIRKLESKDDVFRLSLHEGYNLIPCGHCIGCRLDYSRRWADRMMLELETSKKAVFITLTYNDLNAHWTEVTDYYYGNCGKLIPCDGYTTLDKKDAQLWMKRLRKEFDGYKLRFYLCGEYGSKNNRAHMHAIIFGIDLNDIGDTVVYKRSELGDFYYQSKRIWKTWRKGFVCVANVNWKTCAYVSRYVTKKLNGPYQIDYINRCCIPEFALMSRKPGIGFDYLSLHPDALDMENIPISTENGCMKISIPKYYIDKLSYESKNNNLYNPERYAKMIADRKKFAQDANLLKMRRTTKDFIDYKMTEEMNKNAQLNALKRNKVR